MKSITRSKSLALTATMVAGILLLPSWSPPSPDLKVQVGAQTNATNFRGFVGGNDNILSHSSFDSGFGAVVGNNNTAFLSSGVMAGNSNIIASGSTSSAQTLQSSGVFGNSNSIPQSRSNLLVAGSQNTVNADVPIALNFMAGIAARECKAASQHMPEPTQGLPDSLLLPEEDTNFQYSHLQRCGFCCYCESFATKSANNEHKQR
jgi:hypothetical protein